MLRLFYLFTDENKLLSGFLPFYQNKLQDQGIQDAFNIIKIKFGPYADLVRQIFFKIKENLIKNLDRHSQIEKDGEPGAKYLNENTS